MCLTFVSKCSTEDRGERQKSEQWHLKGALHQRKLSPLPDFVVNVCQGACFITAEGSAAPHAGAPRWSNLLTRCDPIVFVWLQRHRERVRAGLSACQERRHIVLEC